MNVTFFGICDLASITREGKLNIMGIFKQIFVQQLPTRYLKFTVVGVLDGEPGKELKISLSVVDPTGERVLPEQQMQVKVGEGGGANLMFQVANLPINNTGDHLIVLKENGKQIAETKFGVVKAEPRQPVGGVQ
jgi:hypothetical protein